MRLQLKVGNEKGMTLVEILAALVILSIVLISFSSFFLQSAKNTKNNEAKLTAVAVAEEVVAEVRMGSYSERSVSEEFTESGHPGYEVSIKIEEGPTGTNLNKAIITVKPELAIENRGKWFITEMYFEKEETP